MGKSYKQWSPTESYLFPPAPQDWLPAGHLAYFVMEFVEESDLSAIDEASSGRTLGVSSRFLLG